MCAKHVWVVVIAVASAGCSEGGRRELSGAVTYDGQPVPRGMVIFEPDTTQGASGPGTSVAIQDGRYRTEPGFGVAGGPHRIRVTGYTADPDPRSRDGSLKPLFGETPLTVDIPAKGDFDIDVPGKTGKK